MALDSTAKLGNGSLVLISPILPFLRQDGFLPAVDVTGASCARLDLAACGLAGQCLRSGF